MKILTADSKLWWLAVADEIRPASGTAVYDAVQKFSAAFQFAASPTALPGPSDGYTFREGALAVGIAKVAIKEVTIFNDGLSLEVYSNTDDLLFALERVLAVLKEIGFRDPITSPRIVFNSSITVDLRGNMNQLISVYDPMSKLMNDVFGVEGPCDAKVIEFSMDPKFGPPLNSTTFRLERRANVEYSLNRYFSFANTTTKNHIRLLEQVEASLVGISRS